MKPFLAITILAQCLCLPALRAEDFTVSQGYDDGIGTKTVDAGAGTVRFGSPDARWFWYLNFNQPGYYNVEAKVAVSAANAGATLELGEYANRHNVSGSVATATLNSTNASSNTNPQWQSIGQVWVPSPGLHFFAARVTSFPGANPGLLHAIRVNGPGMITVDPTWTSRSSACDIYFTPSGSTRRAMYAEMVPRPLPVPAINGTHTVVNMPTGYMGNNDNAFNSLWVSNNQLPAPLVGHGPSRVYTHEGTGSTITLADFSLDPTRRRKTLQISVPDGNGNTLSTFLVGEVGQRWHFGGRMRQYTSVGASSSGFLENPSAFNAQVNCRSCAWGNVWAYGSQSGGADAWWANTSIRGHLRGPSPADLPDVTGVYPYGKSRQRQDMVEMVIGGLIPISQNDTTYSGMPCTAPDLPSLNLAYDLQATDIVNQASHATVATPYADATSVPNQIRDPHSSLAFTYSKVSGPSWIMVSSAGALAGTPLPADAGQNTLVVRATDPKAGLSGDFTVAVYVRASAGANNPPAFQSVVPAVQTVATADDSQLIELPVIDPDGDTPAYSIVSGNGGGQFGFGNGWLVKTAALTPGTTYPLTIQVSDGGGLTDTVDVAVTAVAGTGGATEEIWYLTDGATVADLTSDPRFPDSPTQLDAVRDFNETAAGLSTGYRVRAYLTPPATGIYTFSMTASDVDGELRVSSDESPANLVLKATTSGTTGTASLVAGQRYFIESLGLNGADYNVGSFTARWSGPGIPTQTIPQSMLTPFRYVTPKLWDGTLALRDVLTGESYSENLRPKLDTMHLWDVLNYEKLNGPSWLSISSDGIVTGTPGEGDVGSNTATVRVTAPGGHWDVADFTVQVIADSAPQFNGGTINLAAIDEGSEITGSLATYAGDVNLGTRLGFGDRLSYQIVGGPAWLGCEPTGELFGTPGAPHIGPNTFTVKATDLGGLSATTQLQVIVNEIANTPVFVRAPVSLNASSSSAFHDALGPYVNDPDVGETLTFLKLSGPSWLTVATNGTLGGTPSIVDLGTNTFSVRVTDSTGRWSNGSLQVIVKSPDPCFYEGFEGTAGATLQGSGSGTGWLSGSKWTTSSGTASTLVEANAFTGLTYRGLSATMSGGEDYTRTLEYSHTIGNGAGETPELWLSWSLQNPGPISVGHSFLLGLTHASSAVLSCGKDVNSTWNLNGGGQSAVLVNSSSTGNIGNWTVLLHLAFNGTDTVATAYLAKEGDPGLDPLDPGTYLRIASVTLVGPLTFDGVTLITHNTTTARFDEISLGYSAARALNQAADTDNDGTPNYLDDDDDGDDLPDLWEVVHGFDPLVFNEINPPEPSVPASVDVGLVASNNGSFEFTVPVRNIGTQLPLEVSASLTGPADWEIVTTQLTIPAGETGLVVVRIHPGPTPGIETANLLLSTNSPSVPTATVAMSALIAPSGIPLAHFSFDPDTSSGTLLDSNHLTPPADFTISNLIDRATGTGALSASNQSATNRAVQTVDSNVLWVSCKREEDAQTPVASGGGNESTWMTFDVAVAQGSEINFSGASLFARTFARTTLSNATTANWSLYASFDQGATYELVSTKAGASTANSTVTHADLVFDLTPLGIRTGSVRFAIDPVSAQNTNGTVIQRAVGIDDVILTANFAGNAHTLTYSAGPNGAIAGTSPQTVADGSDGTSVAAVADTGYHFADWSDGSTANPRTDTNVTADLSVTANFILSNPDANGNGILDTWETEMFGNSDPGANPADGDPDGDGLANLLEYALNTDPLQANANPIISGFTTVGADSFLRLVIPKNPDAANVSYIVETSGDLESGGWSSANTVVVVDSASELIVRDTIANAPRRFIRLKVIAATVTP